MSDLKSRLKGLAEGAIDFIGKPFSFKELDLKIHALIYQSKKYLEEFILTNKKRLEYEILFMKQMEDELKTNSFLKLAFEKNCKLYNLTKAEIEIARLYINPKYMQKQIAYKLNKSHKTISCHINNMYKKLGIDNQTDFIMKMTKI
jgi:DNA-binding NarL/FixJ family response regulator